MADTGFEDFAQFSNELSKSGIGPPKNYDEFSQGLSSAGIEAPGLWEKTKATGSAIGSALKGGLTTQLKGNIAAALEAGRPLDETDWKDTAQEEAQRQLQGYATEPGAGSPTLFPGVSRGQLSQEIAPNVPQIVTNLGGVLAGGVLGGIPGAVAGAAGALAPMYYQSKTQVARQAIDAENARRAEANQPPMSRDEGLALQERIQPDISKHAGWEVGTELPGTVLETLPMVGWMGKAAAKPIESLVSKAALKALGKGVAKNVAAQTTTEPAEEMVSNIGQRPIEQRLGIGDPNAKDLSFARPEDYATSMGEVFGPTVRGMIPQTVLSAITGGLGGVHAGRQQYLKDQAAVPVNPPAEATTTPQPTVATSATQTPQPDFSTWDTDTLKGQWAQLTQSQGDPQARAAMAKELRYRYQTDEAQRLGKPAPLREAPYVGIESPIPSQPVAPEAQRPDTRTAQAGGIGIPTAGEPAGTPGIAIANPEPPGENAGPGMGALAVGAHAVGATEPSVTQPVEEQTHAESNIAGARSGATNIPGFFNEEPPALQGFLNAPPMDSKADRYLVPIQSAIKHGYSSLNIPQKRLVVHGMARLIKDDQVFRGVVASIPVDVMHYFIGGKIPTNNIGHYKSMFIRRLISNPNNSITARIVDIALSSPAFSAAEMTKWSFGDTRRHGERIPAEATRNEILSHNRSNIIQEINNVTSTIRKDQSLLGQAGHQGEGGEIGGLGHIREPGQDQGTALGQGQGVEGGLENAQPQPNPQASEAETQREGAAGETTGEAGPAAEQPEPTPQTEVAGLDQIEAKYRPFVLKAAQESNHFKEGRDSFRGRLNGLLTPIVAGRLEGKGVLKQIWDHVKNQPETPHEETTPRERPEIQSGRGLGPEVGSERPGGRSGHGGKTEVRREENGGAVGEGKEEKSLIKRYGLPESTAIDNTRGKGLAKGKWQASADGLSSNFHDAKEDAAKELANFIEAGKANEKRAKEIEEGENNLASKIKSGEEPTMADWQRAFTQLKENHTYLRQPDISQFLVKHFGFSKARINAGLKEAAGKLTTDSGTSYPIVYFKKLAKVLQEKAKQAQPVESHQQPPGETQAPLSGVGETQAPNKEAIKDLATLAKTLKEGNAHYIDYSDVTPEEASRIKETIGADVTGYKHHIGEAAIRHALRQHGDPKTEAKRGQIAITPEDFAEVPNIVSHPDSIMSGGKTHQGNEKLVYTKRIGDVYYLVEEVRSRRKKLALVTLWKTRDAPRATSTDGVAQTSETITQRLPQHDKSKAGKPEEGKFSRSQSPASGQTTASIRAELKARLGPLLDRMERAGLLKITEAPADLPADIAAEWDGQKSILYADRIAPGEAYGKLLHENGVHGGLERGFIDPLIKGFKSLLRSSDPIAERVETHVQKLLDDEALTHENADFERLAYAVEFAANAKPATLSGKFKLWLARALAQFKAWFYKTPLYKAMSRLGIRLPLNAYDLAALARAAMFKVRAGAEQESYNPLGYAPDDFVSRQKVGAALKEIIDRLSENNNSDVRYSRNAPVPEEIQTKGKPAGWLLSLLQRNHIVEIYGNELPELNAYKEQSDLKDADSSNANVKADREYQERVKKLDKAQADELGWVQTAVSAAGFEPDPQGANHFVPEQPSGFVPPFVQEQYDRQMEIQRRFNALPEASKAVYREMRQAYIDLSQRRLNALIQNISETIHDPVSRSDILKKIELQYSNFMSTGVYFPLARFGNHIVTGIKLNEDGTENTADRTVSFFETHEDALRAARQMKSEGGFDRVQVTTRAEYNAEDAASRELKSVVAKVDRAIEGTTEFDEDSKRLLMDSLHQSLLQALPDASVRKHFIHRKGTPGWSVDTIRALADAEYRGGLAIANLKYGHKIQGAIAASQKRIKSMDGDTSAIQDAVNELIKREKVLASYEVNPISALFTQLGFFGAMGANLSSALANMMQVPMVTLPYLAGRFGGGRSLRELQRAYGALFNKNNLSRESGLDLLHHPMLNRPENQPLKRALEQLVKDGKINLTLAHDLIEAGRRASFTETKGQKAVRRVAQWSSFPFHMAEAANRQVTAMAAFRMKYADEIKRGADPDEAYKKAYNLAVDAIDRSHFNYSTSNRSRAMMGNTARVLTLFKAYALGITYFMGRNAYLSLKSADPEERAIARKTLAWTLGMSFMTSGLFGLPIGAEAFGIAGGVAGFQKFGKKGAVAGAIGGVVLMQALIAGLGGDDDDDLKAQFRNWAADAFGIPEGEALAHGPARALLSYLGIEGDISSRLDLYQTFIRPPNKQQEGKDALSAWLSTLAGPIAGQLGNWAMGAKYMHDGQYERAFEAFMPSSVKNLAKAGRFSTEGVKTLTQQNLLKGSTRPELTWNEILGQAIGFTPRRVAEVYESNTAITQKRDRLNIGRERLMNQWLNLDPSERANFFRDRIKPWNLQNPTHTINGLTLMNSLRGRARNAAQTQQGLYLPRKQQALRAFGDFANS